MVKDSLVAEKISIKQKSRTLYHDHKRMFSEHLRKYYDTTLQSEKVNEFVLKMEPQGTLLENRNLDNYFPGIWFSI